MYIDILVKLFGIFILTIVKYCLKNFFKRGRHISLNSGILFGKRNTK